MCVVTHKLQLSPVPSKWMPTKPLLWQVLMRCSNQMTIRSSSSSVRRQQQQRQQCQAAAEQGAGVACKQSQ
jgi:hypothetical protein